jgi:hypothetical protein
VTDSERLHVLAARCGTSYAERSESRSRVGGEEAGHSTGLISIKTRDPRTVVMKVTFMVTKDLHAAAPHATRVSS